MINNDTIRAKRRKRSANTIDLNDPVAMRLRIIRLEEEVERDRIIMNVFASLLPGFIKRKKQAEHGSKKFTRWLSGVKKYIKNKGSILPFKFNENPTYEQYEVENLKEFCNESGLCAEDLYNFKPIKGNIMSKEEAARLLKLESERIDIPNSFVGDLILAIYEMGERDAKEI